MDQDGNGYIDRNEFSAIFSKGGLKCVVISWRGVLLVSFPSLVCSRITAEVEGQEFSGFMGFFATDDDAK